MKLVCLGDSITLGYKVKASDTWPSLVSRKLNIEVLNKGINGDTTGGMLGRFNSDVISERPTHVIIMGGGNDAIWGVPLPVVEANMAAMAQQAIYYQIIPIIGIPIPFNVTQAKKHWPIVSNFELSNQNLKEYRKWILSFSKNFSIPVLDFSEIFICNEYDVQVEYFVDGVHPTPTGNELMSNLVVQRLLNL